MIKLLSLPLGYIMFFCYTITNNYGWAILVFTLLVKALMFPLSLSSQKNSIKMIKLQPMIEDIKARYAQDPNLILQKQKALYKEEKYNLWIGLLPLLIQIPIIIGLIQVMYHPLTYLLRVDSASIEALFAVAAEHTGTLLSGSSGEITLIGLIKDSPSVFSAAVPVSGLIDQILAFDLSFYGINLSQTPSFTGPLLLLLFPFFSAVSAFALSVYQNKVNVLQQEQSGLSKWGMCIFLTAFSGYFAFVVPVGIGLYWIAGNLLSILVTKLCNVIYDPRKLIDYENRPVKKALTPQEKKAHRLAMKVKKQKGKEDARRFYAFGDKELVFYSEGKGYYKYFSGMIENLLQNSEIIIHYITSDDQDPVLMRQEERFHTYFSYGNGLIPLMMKMDAKIVVMTMPDLEQFHLKRSLVKPDAEYIYIDHGMTSLHMMLREGALDHYDTIFCTGPNHMAEVRAMEAHGATKEKTLVAVGYPLLDEMLEKVQHLPERNKDKKTFDLLIAPSWQKDNLMEYELDALLTPLLADPHYRVTLRPHPEFVKRYPAKVAHIQEKYQQGPHQNFVFETDFSSNQTVFEADLVITDWSSIAQEFSYATKKPSLFINTPMKVMNPNYQAIPLVPLDISLREEIGFSIDPEDLGSIHEKVETLRLSADAYREKITSLVTDNIYHIGASAKAATAYLLSSLEEK
ncbi:MAG: membrane protein insertase YidC [Clostridiales bacterium]|nr:membrane protein insertase YidC [Clostridiales bacterium]